MSTVVVINTKYTYIKYIFILIGMALWINAPILGIFPILLFVFLNHNSDEEYDQNSSNNVIVNNFLLLLVVLTLTFFCALVDIQADTLEYVNEYQQCRNINPVECFQSRPYPFEPGFYLLSYVFFSISNGSNLGFLLLWSFVTDRKSVV